MSDATNEGVPRPPRFVVTKAVVTYVLFAGVVTTSYVGRVLTGRESEPPQGGVPTPGSSSGSSGGGGHFWFSGGGGGWSGGK